MSKEELQGRTRERRAQGSGEGLQRCWQGPGHQVLRPACRPPQFWTQHSSHWSRVTSGQAGCLQRL